MQDSVTPPLQPRVKGKRAMDAFLDEIKRYSTAISWVLVVHVVSGSKRIVNTVYRDDQGVGESLD